MGWEVLRTQTGSSDSKLGKAKSKSIVVLAADHSFYQREIIGEQS